MTTALTKTTKKTTKTKKAPTKKAPTKKAQKPEPTNAQIDAAIDLVELAHDMVCALDEAAAAPTLDEYQGAVAECGAVAARFMRRFAMLAGKLDPEALRAAEERYTALPAVTAPALAQ